MSDSEWFSKLKSHTYAWRVVHTALLETEQLAVSLEFVFLLIASILYVIYFLSFLKATVSGNLLKNNHFVRYPLINQQCTCNNDKKQFNTLCVSTKQAATLIRLNHKCLCCCPKR